MFTYILRKRRNDKQNRLTTSEIIVTATERHKGMLQGDFVDSFNGNFTNEDFKGQKIEYIVTFIFLVLSKIT